MGGLNTYAYVGSNPLRYKDPFGLDAVDFGYGGGKKKGNGSVNYRCLVFGGDCSGSASYDAGFCKITVKRNENGDLEFSAVPKLPSWGFGPFSAGPTLDLPAITNNIGDAIEQSQAADSVKDLRNKTQQELQNLGIY